MILLIALSQHVTWRKVGSLVYSRAAQVDGCWWVLRLNDFPEHPLYTLFIDGDCVGDLDDPPPAWRYALGPPSGRLSGAERGAVLRLMRGLARYGAEAGQPCDGDWCACSILTDDYAAQDEL